MVKQEEFTENYSDDEFDRGTHNKLLRAVSRIYKKQRVDKPKRSEPYANVSEYHLSNYENNEANNEKIQVFDLVKVLNRKASHQQIKSKYESVKDRSAKLPKPLEKVYADKIKRSVGYEHVKHHVSRWNEIVEQNRSAPQLSFPLKDDSEVKVYQPLQFLHAFKEPTELEKNMAEVLEQSSVAQFDSQVEEAIFNLSIPEMIEKRKLIAKLKAKESFKIVKAIKQNKIKSKKYRRILRKERVKQELKDFETLQRTDPEAALEKLNKLEKERAEERASLRHRNTGKWARGQAIRAKYDKEARIQLGEQIAKSRELTRKRKLDNVSCSEEELDEEEDCEDTSKEQAELKEADDNPWTQKEKEPEETVDDFVAGYQNYWKNKKNQLQTEPSINKAALARLTGTNSKIKTKLDADDRKSSDSSAPSAQINPNISTVERVSINESLSDEEIDSFKNSVAKLNIDKNKIEKDGKISECDDPMSRLEQNVTLENYREPVSSEQKSTEDNIVKSIKGYDSYISSNSNNFSPGKSEENNHEYVSKDGVSGLINSSKKAKAANALKETKANKQTPKSENRKRCSKCLIEEETSVTNISGLWVVTPDKSNAKYVRKNKTLDDMFDKMEGDLQAKVQERLNNFENVSSCNEIEEPKYKKRELNVTNAKSKTLKPEVSIIIETTEKECVGRDEDLDNLLKVIEDDNEKEKSTKDPVIDPNKFLNVKPRVLNTQVPDLLTEGDNMLDDPEDDRRINISEAFAEDDVVKEFVKEKEEEMKSSENQDVDLFLPGWGSWGGPSTDPSKMKKKKNRLFMKAPELKRKDASKPNVIINEDISEKYKTHLVSEVPFPFTSVRDFEASIRAPLGSTWVPETAVSKLTKPPVIKKLGTVIEPMSEAYLIKNNKKKSALKINNFSKKDGNPVK